MRQIVAILLDSLRMLRAAKVFWVSMILSSLIGLVYLSIALESDGYSVLFGLKKWEHAVLRGGTAEGEWLYVNIFTQFIYRFWLGVGAILLALISTVSVFPEFTRDGAVEIALSKPVSRMKLFLTKYVGCLLFVAIQSVLFAVLVFAALIWRLDYVNWSIFWVVPVIVFAFSLIHCVQVLVGVLTRSSVISLLVGICFWGVVWLIQLGADVTYKQGYALDEVNLGIDWGGGGIVEKNHEDAGDSTSKDAYDAIDKISTPLPKIRDLTLSLEQLVKFRDSGSLLEKIQLGEMIRSGGTREQKEMAAERLTRERHSLIYMVLTSLGFELVVVSMACWIFCRRDY